MGRSNLAAWIESALSGVIAYLLSLLPTMTAAGAGANLSVIPVFIISYRRGWKFGILSGFLNGVLQIVLGRAAILNFWQVFIEYMFAFALAGVAGFFASRVKSTFSDDKSLWPTISIIGLSTFVGTLVEYFVHFLAGYFFWASFTPEGMNPWFYTFAVNSITGLITWVVAWIVVWLILWTNSSVIEVKKN